MKTNLRRICMLLVGILVISLISGCGERIPDGSAYEQISFLSEKLTRTLYESSKNYEGVWWNYSDLHMTNIDHEYTSIDNYSFDSEGYPQYVYSDDAFICLDIQDIYITDWGEVAVNFYISFFASTGDYGIVDDEFILCPDGNLDNMERINTLNRLNGGLEEYPEDYRLAYASSGLRYSDDFDSVDISFYEGYIIVLLYNEWDMSETKVIPFHSPNHAEELFKQHVAGETPVIEDIEPSVVEEESLALDYSELIGKQFGNLEENFPNYIRFETDSKCGIGGFESEGFNGGYEVDRVDPDGSIFGTIYCNGEKYPFSYLPNLIVYEIDPTYTFFVNDNSLYDLDIYSGWEDVVYEESYYEETRNLYDIGSLYCEDNESTIIFFDDSTGTIISSYGEDPFHYTYFYTEDGCMEYTLSNDRGGMDSGWDLYYWPSDCLILLTNFRDYFYYE